MEAKNLHLHLHFYEPGLDTLHSQIDELIENGYRNFLLVPQNETSETLIKKFQSREGLVFNSAQNITDSLSPAVIVITEANADLVSEHLLNCHNIKSGIVLAPITIYHYSNQSLYISCIPKSGTHMLIKMLEVMGIQSNSSSLPCNGKWNIIPKYSYHTPCKKFTEEQFSNAMLPMGKHPIFQSSVIFMYRNPLDIIISELLWFAKPSELWSHYLNNFEDIDSKLLALIESPLLGNIRERMLNYIDWLDFSNVIPVSYEELVGSQGGGSDKEQKKTIWSIQLKLHVPGCPQEIAKNIYDKKSPTFSKGKIGQHKKLFKKNHYDRFKALPQDFMEKMGCDFDAVFSKHVEYFRQRPLKIWKPSINELWEQRLIKESFYGFNIVYAGGQYIVLDQRIGSIDLSIEANRTQDGVYTGFGSCEDAVAFVIIKESQVRAKTSTCESKQVYSEILMIVKENYKGFNIVAYNGKYYAVAPSLGRIDFTSADLKTYEDSLQFAVGESIDDAMQLVDKLIIFKTEISDRDSRIEALQEEITQKSDKNTELQALLKENGEKLSIAQQELSEKDRKIEALQGEIAEMDERINTLRGVKVSSASAPILLDSYKGYNFVQYGDHIYAISQALGPLDLSQDEENLSKYEGSDKCIITDSLFEARYLVSQIRCQELEKELGEREKSIETLREEVNSSKESCGKLTDDLNKKDEMIETLQIETTRKDSDIEKLWKDIEDKKASIVKLLADISDKDSRIEALQGELSQRETTIQELHKGISDRDSMISSLQNEIAGRNSKIECFQKELDEIKSKNWFKIAKKIGFK